MGHNLSRSARAWLRITGGSSRKPSNGISQSHRTPASVYQPVGDIGKRRSLTSNGSVRYQLKTPYRDGTTQVIFEPLDFIARLAALAWPACGGAVRIIACIEDPVVIEKILAHLAEAACRRQAQASIRRDCPLRAR